MLLEPSSNILKQSYSLGTRQVLPYAQIKLPGLNRGAMSSACIAICELSLSDGWPEFLSSFDRSRVGIYAVCFDSYDFDPAIYQDWSLEKDIRNYLRTKVPPTVALKRSAGMTSGSLSILLQVTGPIYTFPYLKNGQEDCEKFSSLDLSENRIDLAILAWSVTSDNVLDTDSGIQEGCWLCAKGRPA